MEKFIDTNTFQQLHQQFHLTLKTQGKSQKTQSSYLRSFRRLALYFPQHPDELTQNDLKQYFADLLDSHSWSSVKVDRWAFKIFWEHVLEKEWQWPKIAKPPKTKRLPDILTIEEVDKLMSNLEKLRYRTCLFTIYSMGLRLGEGINLKVSDIDSKRMLVHVRNAKGNKDRFVPLSDPALKLLRHYWCTHQNPNLLFPVVHLGKSRRRHTNRPMDYGGVQTAFKLALEDSGIHKKASVHTLRHSYATHLMEAGVNLRVIQEYLGHASPNTTVIYAHLSKPVVRESEALVRELMDRFLFTRRKSMVLKEDD